MSDESIRIMCPSLTCRRVLAVPISARGRTVRCRNCGTNIRIPNKAEPAKTPPPQQAGGDSSTKQDETKAA